MAVWGTHLSAWMGYLMKQPCVWLLRWMSFALVKNEFSLSHYEEPHMIGLHSIHQRPDCVPRVRAAQTMRVPGRTGNAWSPEQIFMEIISGNPNVNKSVSDLGMREDGGKSRRGVVQWTDKEE